MFIDLLVCGTKGDLFRITFSLRHDGIHEIKDKVIGEICVDFWVSNST